jgi:hypothetical protein
MQADGWILDHCIKLDKFVLIFQEHEVCVWVNLNFLHILLNAKLLSKVDQSNLLNLSQYCICFTCAPHFLKKLNHFGIKEDSSVGISKFCVVLNILRWMSKLGDIEGGGGTPNYKTITSNNQASQIATLGPSWNFSLTENLASLSLQGGPRSGTIITQPPSQPATQPGTLIFV